MPQSAIFHSDAYRQIQQRIVALLDAQPDFLTPRTAASPRAAGDAIQAILSEHFRSVLGEHCADYSAEFARRAMADLAFTDRDGFYCVVDVKTHRLETRFNMPNLTSVERLSRFYEDDRNYFVMLMIRYEVEGIKINVREALFVPIEFLSWECLTIGALGWGQVQIANANVIQVNQGYPRKRWMVELCDVMLQFYPRELEKIGERIEHFKRLREFWDAKPED